MAANQVGVLQRWHAACDEPTWQYWIGRTYEEHGFWNEATDAYRAVIERDPEHASSHFRLGCVLEETGAVTEAAAAFAAAVDLDPSEKGWQARLARAHLGSLATPYQARKQLQSGSLAGGAEPAAGVVAPLHSSSITGWLSEESGHDPTLTIKLNGTAIANARAFYSAVVEGHLYLGFRRELGDVWSYVGSGDLLTVEHEGHQLPVVGGGRGHEFSGPSRSEDLLARLADGHVIDAHGIVARRENADPPWAATALELLADLSSGLDGEVRPALLSFFRAMVGGISDPSNDLEEGRLLQLAQGGTDQVPAETVKAGRNRMLMAVDDIAAELESSPVHGEVASIVRAQIASLLEAWDEAITRWQRVVRDVPAAGSLANLQLARAYRSTASFNRAHRSLDRAAERDGSTLVDDERRLLARREREWASRVVGNLAVDLLVASVRPRLAQDLLRSCVQLRTESPMVRACITAVADDVSHHRGIAPRVARSITRRSGIPSIERPRCIFFCGFGWSGSGALYDYFSQSDLAVLPFRATEIRAFENDWSANRAAREIRSGEIDPREALLRFIFHSVLGVGGSMTLPADKLIRQSILNALRASPEELDQVAALCCRLYRRAMSASADESEPDLLQAFQDFFDSVIGLRAKGPSVALMSNCIHSERVNLVRFVTRGTAVAVVRDPRDQYVAQHYEHSNRQNLSVDRFIATLQRQLKRYERAAGSLDRADQIELVRFEEFVLSPSYRDSLSDRLGIPAGSFRAENLAYRPEQSTKNVGIYRSYPVTSEIDLIERSFPDLLFAG